MECKIFLCSLVVYKLGGVFENLNYLGQKQNDVTFYFHRTAKILRILEIILVEWYDYKNRRGGQGRRQCPKPRGAWGHTPSQFSRSLTCTSTKNNEWRQFFQPAREFCFNHVSNIGISSNLERNFKYFPRAPTLVISSEM